MKILVKDNYRVEVSIDTPRGSDPLLVAEDIRAQIIRHVDVDKRYVGVSYDSRWVCSFCGNDPEEDAEGPVCCTKAQTEWEANHPKAPEVAPDG